MKENLKKIFKQILIYLLIFVVLISIYMVLMTITSLIPSSYLKENVRESSETLYEEGERKIYDLKYKRETVFTFTDALMINTAYSIDSTKPIESFLLARKNYIPGQTEKIYIDSQYNLGASEQYINKENGDLYQTKELYGLMHGENITSSFEYARYWHGYLIILRPLLALFNYEMIRVVLFIITLILIITMLILIYKKINLTTSIIYGISLLGISIFIASQAVNDVLVYLIAFTSTIILLIKSDKMKHFGRFFFIIGSITSFVDLLTAPLITLGITGITYFLLLQTKEEKISLKQYIIEILKICILWAIGYAITWASKWVIVQIIYKRPLIAQSIEQVLFRANMSNKVVAYKFTSLQVIRRNLDYLSTPVILAVLVISIGYIIFNIIKNLKRDIDFKENFKDCIPYIFTFILPILWYIVTKEHSFTHAMFAYRILVISIISIFTIISKIFKEKEEVKNGK